jgi:hypothetical protein
MKWIKAGHGYTVMQADRSEFVAIVHDVYTLYSNVSTGFRLADRLMRHQKWRCRSYRDMWHKHHYGGAAATDPGGSEHAFRSSTFVALHRWRPLQYNHDCYAEPKFDKLALAKATACQLHTHMYDCAGFAVQVHSS